MARFPRLRKVAITLRGSINASHNTWGGVLYDGERLYASRRYDITHIVDRVGGGDSFAGGLIHGLLAWPENDARALGSRRRPRVSNIRSAATTTSLRPTRSNV